MAERRDRRIAELKKQLSKRDKVIVELTHIVRAVILIAELYPRYGYIKIAVIYRLGGFKVKNRHAYRAMDEHGFLHRRLCSGAKIYQAAKLYELLPKGPSELWQMYVSYVQLADYGWW